MVEMMPKSSKTTGLHFKLTGFTRSSSLGLGGENHLDRSQGKYRLCGNDPPSLVVKLETTVPSYMNHEKCIGLHLCGAQINDETSITPL